MVGPPITFQCVRFSPSFNYSGQRVVAIVRSRGAHVFRWRAGACFFKQKPREFILRHFAYMKKYGKNRWKKNVRCPRSHSRSQMIHKVWRFDYVPALFSWFSSMGIGKFSFFPLMLKLIILSTEWALKCYMWVWKVNDIPFFDPQHDPYIYICISLQQLHTI